MSKIKLIKWFLYLNVVLMIIYFISCNVDNVISPEDEDVTVEAGFTKSITEVEKICSYVNNYLVVIANNITSFPGSCPSITVNTVFNTITVNYGSTPCSNLSDSIRRSGSYTVNYYINTSKDSVSAIITFNSYRVYKLSNISDNNYIEITGSDTIRSKKQLLTSYISNFSFKNTFTTNNSKSKSVNILLNVNANINNTLPVNSTFYISGSGNAENISLNSSYSFTILPSNAVTFETNCGYPTVGKVYLDMGGNRFTVDFSPYNSGCDGWISITKYGITKYLDLRQADF